MPDRLSANMSATRVIHPLAVARTDLFVPNDTTSEFGDEDGAGNV
jgi:hypothetical protein